VYDHKEKAEKDSGTPAGPPGEMAKRKAPIESDKNKVTLKAKRAYEAQRDDEISLHKDETIAGVRVDEDLWFVTNSFGKCGVVPSSVVYVPEASSGTPNQTPETPMISTSLSDDDYPDDAPPPGIEVSPQEARARILSLKTPPVAPHLPNFLLKLSSQDQDSDEEIS